MEFLASPTEKRVGPHSKLLSEAKLGGGCGDPKKGTAVVGSQALPKSKLGYRNSWTPPRPEQHFIHSSQSISMNGTGDLRAAQMPGSSSPPKPLSPLRRFPPHKLGLSSTAFEVFTQF